MGRFRFSAAALSVLALLLAARAAAGDDWRLGCLAEARLAAARLARLEHMPADELWVRQRLAWENARLRASLRSLALNVAPVRRPGLRLEAYVSANDDSAQPFLRYLPPSWSPDRPAPLLVFLHGYDPSMDELFDPYIPDLCARIADRAGAVVAAPFGRANTDYQGIGEQDVLRVVDEMAGRFNIDRQRVVLFGWSMGGLGAWCLAARHPDRFNGVFVLSGRGDFYLWHGLQPADLPPWQRRLVDVQFATAWLPNVTNLTVLAAHGMRDNLIGFSQGRGMFERYTARNAHGIFLGFPEDGHGVFDSVLLHPRTLPWLGDALLHAKPKDRPTGLRPGETGSRVQNAFLRPFAFVGAHATDPQAASRTVAARAAEWHRFAKAEPRTMIETAIDTNVAVACHLFLFGEPETSELVRRVLTEGGVRWRTDAFRVAGRTLTRDGHGLWFTGRNPFNPQRLAIVQCGLPWGANLREDNHRYDRIPDAIAYGPETDRWGNNLADAAGFLDDQWRVQWFDPPVTDAIRKPPEPAWPEAATDVEWGPGMGTEK
jgi:pimeloyl-ACP methyl ester carboxylesterase